MKKETKPQRTFRHLTQSDRDRIEALLDADETQKEIAKILNVSESAVSREIRRRQRKNDRYSATAAQHKAQVLRSNSKHQGMKIEACPDLRNFIIEELKQKRSPDEIAGRMKATGQTPRVGTSAIYKWLYGSHGQAYCRYLCTQQYKKRKQKRTEKRIMIPDRVSLEHRPTDGIHAEGDLFVSPTKLKTTKSGALLCVPETKLLVGTFVPDRTPASMVQAVQRLVSGLRITDLTFDNGIENRNHAEFGLPTYFCDPHAPWQKPHVENEIGLIRRWFLPKGTDLRTVPEATFQVYLEVLNHKYRKSLGYRSAYEVSEERGILAQNPLTGVKKKT